MKSIRLLRWYKCLFGILENYLRFIFNNNDDLGITRKFSFPCIYTQDTWETLVHL